MAWHPPPIGIYRKGLSIPTKIIIFPPFLSRVMFTVAKTHLSNTRKLHSGMCNDEIGSPLRYIVVPIVSTFNNFGYWIDHVGNCLLPLVGNILKKNRSRLSIAVLLTTLTTTMDKRLRFFFTMFSTSVQLPIIKSRRLSLIPILESELKCMLLL
jgi:hypothetical protein